MATVLSSEAVANQEEEPGRKRAWKMRLSWPVWVGEVDGMMVSGGRERCN